MRSIVFALACASTLTACGVETPAASSPAAVKPLCECGPDYCRGDPRYAPALTRKKAALRADSYPDRLVALLDRASPCLAAVEQAPDGFTLQVVELDPSRRALAWTSEGEEIAKKNLKERKIKSYQVFNVNRALQCCGDPKYDERRDYDGELDLNTDLALLHR